MKKIFCIALFGIAFIIPMKAQDTVRYGDSCYLFKELTSNLLYNAYISCHRPFNGPEIKVCTAYTAVPVYGVAATMWLCPSDDTVTSWYTAYLYRDLDTCFELVDSSTAYSVKNMFLYSALQNGRLHEEYVPSLEFYFSHPHTMGGLFAVGLKRKIHQNNPFDTIGVYHIVHGIATGNDREYYGSPERHETITRTGGWWGVFFPIIQPERIRCEGAVAEVERGEGYAVVKWETDGDSSMLSVAPYGVDADSGLVTTVQGFRYMATGLDTGVYYAVRLRTQCHHTCHIHSDMTVWSGWGEPTYFYLGSVEPDTAGIGIRRAEATVDWSLTPNPARGSAEVSCGEEIEGVEVMTVKGETVLSIQRPETVGRCAVRLDLAGMERGVYIVRVTTARGVGVRKMVVE